MSTSNGSFRAGQQVRQPCFSGTMVFVRWRSVQAANWACHWSLFQDKPSCSHLCLNNLEMFQIEKLITTDKSQIEIELISDWETDRSHLYNQITFRHLKDQLSHVTIRIYGDTLNCIWAASQCLALRISTLHSTNLASAERTCAKWRCTCHRTASAHIQVTLLADSAVRPWSLKIWCPKVPNFHHFFPFKSQCILWISPIFRPTNDMVVWCWLYTL